MPGSDSVPISQYLSAVLRDRTAVQSKNLSERYGSQLLPKQAFQLRNSYSASTAAGISSAMPERSWGAVSRSPPARQHRARALRRLGAGMGGSGTSATGGRAELTGSSRVARNAPRMSPARRIGGTGVRDARVGPKPHTGGADRDHASRYRVGVQPVARCASASVMGASHLRATRTRPAIAASATVRMTWVLRSATCWARSAANCARSAACRTRCIVECRLNVGDLCFGILDGFEIHGVPQLCRQLPRRETGLDQSVMRWDRDPASTRGDEHAFDSGGHGGILDRGVAR